MQKFYIIILLILPIACTNYKTSIDNSPGRSTRTQPINENIYVSKGEVGIGTNNIYEVCDIMVRDMLASPSIAGNSSPKRVIINSEYFTNESSNIINKDIIIDRLRIELMRAARGRIVFIGRQYSDMVEKERQLKRQGNVQPGTMAASPAQMGGDYRLAGKINSYDKINPNTGLRVRLTQMTFNMIDLESGQIVWSNLYDFKKIGKGVNPVYR